MNRIRLTSREVALRMNCRPVEAIGLLRAAGICGTRCGSSWLWDSASVDRLVNTLKQQTAELVEANA